MPPRGGAAEPGFTPGSGTFTNAPAIALSSATDGASIYYTLDGSAPLVSSSLYSGPFTLGTTTTVKAIAVKAEHGDSLPAEATFVFDSVSYADFSGNAKSSLDSLIAAVDSSRSFGIAGRVAMGGGADVAGAQEVMVSYEAGIDEPT